MENSEGKQSVNPESTAAGPAGAEAGTPGPQAGLTPDAETGAFANTVAGADLPPGVQPASGGSPYGERRTVGVGPYVGPWPEDPRLDPELLAAGDHRNVLDEYRYWTVAAIKADLDTRRAPLHIAIENLQHDLNIGSIVRSANAFNVAGVHIVGRHKWNRRGALVTDRYLNMHYHREPAELAQWAQENSYELVAIDNQEGATPIESTALPAQCVLVFGQESAGISPELLELCDSAVEISQYGSTRSLNVAAAAAIAMFAWSLQHQAARN